MQVAPGPEGTQSPSSPRLPDDAVEATSPPFKSAAAVTVVPPLAAGVISAAR